MRKISTIITIVIVLSLGILMRKTARELDQQAITDAINEYNQSLAKTGEIKNKLEKSKGLNTEEVTKLKELEERYETLLTTFNDYKANYPETISEEIKIVNEENELYSNQVSELESKVTLLNNQIVKQEQVVASSSSSSKPSSSTGSSNTSSSSKPSGSTGSSNSSSSSTSSFTVYANGGTSKSNKYHKTPTAHNMEGAIPMSEAEAKSKGYVACKRCY